MCYGFVAAYFYFERLIFLGIIQMEGVVKAPCFDDLKLAQELMQEGQNKVYWSICPVPKRPLGRVFLEPLRQIAAVLVPLSIIAYCIFSIGLETVWLTVPLGIVLGCLLDRQVEGAIKKQLIIDRELDRGRYSAVRTLSYSLEIPPEEITLQLIENLAKECLRVNEKIARQQAEAQQRAKNNSKVKKVDGNFRSTSTMASACALSTASAFVSDNYVEADDWTGGHYEAPLHLVLNPASGMPMMGNDFSGIDVSGHAYGESF